MSKYDVLWKYILSEGKQELTLSFTEIESICGFPIDHSFLTYKKELKEYGFQIKKISLKEKKVKFNLINENV